MPHASRVSLCVGVTRPHASSERGDPAQWTVIAWATGGNIPDATIRLQATPASGEAPGFSFGCGKDDGTSSCHLGAVDAKSAQRQFRAQLTVPATASNVTSVSLTVVGSAAHLAKAAKASATVSITTTSPGTAAQNPSSPFTPVTVTSPLPIGPLPNIPAASPTLSPGGNAVDLFPTLDPKPTTSRAQPAVPPGRRAHTVPMADTSALPEGAPIVGAQVAGLAALALAFALVITRLSVHRRTATRPNSNTNGATSTAEGSDGTPPEARRGKGEER